MPFAFEFWRRSFQAHGIIRVAEYVVLFCCLFPYIPNITGEGAQPVASAACLIFAAAYGIRKVIYREKLLASELAFIAAFILIVCIQLLKLGKQPIDGVMLLKYLSAILFIWFGSKWLPNLKADYVTLALTIWVASAETQLFFPHTFEWMVAGQQISIGRGPPSLAPESALFSVTVAATFLVVFWFRVTGKITQFHFYVATVITVYGFLLSRSGTAFILMSAVLMLVFMQIILSARSHVVAGSIALITVMVFGQSAVDNMHYQILGPGNILENETLERREDLQNLVQEGSMLEDASLNTRIYYNAVGLLVVLNFDFLGPGTLKFGHDGLSVFKFVPQWVLKLREHIDPKLNGSIHSLVASTLLDLGYIALLTYMGLAILVFRNSAVTRKVWPLALGAVSIWGLIAISPLPVGYPPLFLLAGLLIAPIKQQKETKLDV